MDRHHLAHYAGVRPLAADRSSSRLLAAGRSHKLALVGETGECDHVNNPTRRADASSTHLLAIGNSVLGGKHEPPRGPNPKRMFWRLILALSLCSPPAGAFAQSHRDASGTILGGFAPIYLYVSAGTPQFGISVATATALSAPSGATLAQVCVENAAIRYRDDGIAPTSAIGMPVSSGTCFQYSGPLGAIQFIAQAGSPTIDVLYYKAN